MCQSLRDSRPHPQIPTLSIWRAALLLFLTRRGSLNALESQVRVSRRLQEWLGPRWPSADHIGSVMGLILPARLRGLLRAILLCVRRNKVLPQNCPWSFAAIDGHELFCGRSRHCPQCSTRRVTVAGKEVTEYYHRVVACDLVGQELNLPLDAEPIEPHEGEVVAARRLLERVLKLYPRFFDAVVGDALYFEGPFFNLCLAHHKHVVAVLKDQQRSLFQDALGLFAGMAPQVWREGEKEIRCWDLEGFTSAETIRAPLRVLHTEERSLLPAPRPDGSQQVPEVHSWWWVTTIPKSLLPSPSLCRWAHRRWGIENSLFRSLATHWGLDHCYKHDPVAILNFVLTLFIAHVLLQCFYLRNLKPQLRRRLPTLIALADQMQATVALPESPPVRPDPAPT